jgi:hypothetical protein
MGGFKVLRRILIGAVIAVAALFLLFMSCEILPLLI